MSTLVAPSEKSVEYLQTLFAERFGDELVCPVYDTQAQVSGAIKTLLKDEGQIPASDEAKAEVLELSIALGITVVPGTTQAAVNRQLRTMRRDTQRKEYVKGATDFEAFLATLKPGEDEERAGF